MDLRSVKLSSNGSPPNHAYSNFQIEYAKLIQMLKYCHFLLKLLRDVKMRGGCPIKR